MRSVDARHRNFKKTPRTLSKGVKLLVVRRHTKGQVSCARLRILCSRYAKPPGDVSNSYVVRVTYPPRSEPMLDLALFLGFALLCLYVAYERLCNRW
jgi:hypothetical protein